jgi:hypothetical protein
MPDLSTHNPTTATTPEPQSANDRAAHAAASHVRASVTAAPATVAACQADYASGADLRASFDRRARR